MERASITRSSSPALKVDAYVMPAYHEKTGVQPISPFEPIKSRFESTRTNSPAGGRSYVQDANSGVKKVEMTREELEARLAQNKAEADVIAAEMRREMSEWREQMRSDMRDVKDAIKSQQGSLDKHFSAQESKLTSALQIQEHKFEKSLSDTKLDIIKWALGIPAIAFTLYKIYGAITGAP